MRTTIGECLWLLWFYGLIKVHAYYEAAAGIDIIDYQFIHWSRHELDIVITTHTPGTIKFYYGFIIIRNMQLQEMNLHPAGHI